MIKGFKTTPGLRFSRMMRKFGFSGPMAEIYHPRDSKSYKVWRARVFKKYGSTCSICGSKWPANASGARSVSRSVEADTC